MRFKAFYILYFIVCVFYPTVIIVSPISLRHIFTVVMFILCLIEGGVKLDRFLSWYLVFMFFYAFAEIRTGYTTYIINKFLGTYFASIVLYMSTKVIVQKYRSGRLVLNLFLGVALLNASVAIMQFFHLPFATELPQLLRIDLGEEVLDYYETTVDFYGQYVGGLVGFVLSGYLLSAACVFVLYRRDDGISILQWLLFAIVYSALYFVQERSGFYAGTACSLVYFFSIMKRQKKNNAVSVIIGLIALIVAVLYGSSLVSLEDTRYMTVGIDDSLRANLARSGFDFFLNNPLGGSNEYYASGGYYPHNLIVNAFLYGGLFGGAVLLVIIVTQLVLVFRVFFDYCFRSKHSSLLLAFCVAYLCYTINSFVHNASLALGSEMFFMLWAVIVSLLSLEETDCLSYPHK